MAHWFAGDEEMDARFVPLYRLAAPGTVCSSSHLELPRDALGYYASQIPQQRPDRSGVTRAQLAALHEVPVLVVRGTCDYVPESFARVYEQELDAHLVEIPRAGHSLAEEQPAQLGTVLDAFLDDVDAGKAG